MHSNLRLRVTRALGAIVVVSGAFALTGCANPVEMLINRGAENALEKIIEQGAGGNIDFNTDSKGGYSVETDDGGSVNIGSNASVPSTWPDLPVPAGELIMSSSDPSGGMHNLTFRSTVAEAEKLVANLEGLGFAESGHINMGELRTVTLENSEYQAVVGWFVDGDEASITYMVSAVNR